MVWRSASPRPGSARVMAEDGPDATTGDAQLESPDSAAGVLERANSSAVFDELELATDAEQTPRAFEAEGKRASPKVRSPKASADSGITTPDGNTAAQLSSALPPAPSLARMLGLYRTQSQHLMNADRVEMSSPRHEGRAIRPTVTTKAWIPFTLLGCGTALNWVATFTIGASWQSFGHRYYFAASFVSSIVVHTWQGVQLAEMLDGSSAAVMMECTAHLRVALGVICGWFGLVPVVLAYTTLREGIDSNVFVIQFNLLSFYGLVGNSVPLCLLFVFIGVHEAWLDHADPRFSAFLAAAVIATLISAGTTVFSWEAASRNQHSTEILYDAAFSICKLCSSILLRLQCASTLIYCRYHDGRDIRRLALRAMRRERLVASVWLTFGVFACACGASDGLLTIVSESLRLGVLCGGVAMLSCVGRAAVTVPTAVLALGGYLSYVRAASMVHAWSPQFALLWALINSVLLAIVIVVLLLLQDGDNEHDLVESGSSGSSQQSNHTALSATAVDVSTSYWRSGHCFQGRAEVLHFGVGGGVASLCLAFFALLVDPQVGLSFCRRKSTCLVSERYSSLFDCTAAGKVATTTLEFDFDAMQDE